MIFDNPIYNHDFRVARPQSELRKTARGRSDVGYFGRENARRDRPPLVLLLPVAVMMDAPERDETAGAAARAASVKPTPRPPFVSSIRSGAISVR
jgi:hypothetical protein